MGHSKFPLIALLRRTCCGSPNLQKHGLYHLNASQLQDKIFALLGLASDQKSLKNKGIKPDYTKSWQEVYTLTTSVMLRQGHVSLLSHVQPGRTSMPGELPSWVPDWSQPLTEPLQIFGHDLLTPEPELRASGSIHSTARVRINHDASSCIHGISLEGIICDEIHSIGVFPNRKSSWDVPLDQSTSWPQEWLIEKLRLTYLTRHVEIEARRFLKRAKIEKTSNSRSLDKFNMSNGIIRRSLKRSLFITSTVKLSLGYDNIRAGDVVAVIQGAQIPYVLRPMHIGEYSLVSEAYVDGIIDGEALSGATPIWTDIV
ncbi:hypothetical protein F5Y16DRAFT_423458 [Xylariaceae sp. FL0255]|nr:hypothetical protein F5Y16DRAFT_423458 [Xylariaceae sp. FL0255]